MDEMNNINDMNEVTDTTVTIIEPTTETVVVTKNKKEETAFGIGFELGAGAALGCGAIYGAGFALYKAGEFVCRKIGTARNRRAARKAKKAAEAAKECED